MGGTAELPKPPETPTVFLEDMTEAQMNQAMKIPSGLTNLGNTCYMNATLQCLKPVHELHAFLKKKNQTFSNDNVMNISVALRELYSQLEQDGHSLAPLAFLTTFRSCYPQFAQQDDHGHFAQQDAEESWNQLLTALQVNIENPIPSLLGIQFESISTCDESDADPPTTKTHQDLRITCHLSDRQVTNLHQSILSGLVQKLEKRSEVLQRSCMFTETSKIARLPKYLTVHFARFYWREDIRQRVKIRKNVPFPAQLDMTQYCTNDLQSKIYAYRDAGTVAPEFEKDLLCNRTGNYALCAVLTHIGSSSDSGHYIAWVKTDKDGWFKFDDEKVSQVSEPDVLRTSGVSADGHIAYVILYRGLDRLDIQTT
ncbi:Ubiquitin carboxyl-terminal hydrolase 14 [Coelomomyces lativittatus]|nr:Ubiquitin carboxyl-terminal hydrolase 14 [Coelomomyces lativittatus]